MDSRMRNRVSCYISEDLLYHQAETVFEQIVHCLSFKIIQPLRPLITTYLSVLFTYSKLIIFPIERVLIMTRDHTWVILSCYTGYGNTEILPH